MTIPSLLESARFEVVHIDTTGTALSTDTTSLAIVDAAGYGGLCFVGIVDTVTAAGDVGLELWHGDSSGTFYQCDTDLMPFKITTTTGTDQTVVVLDVVQPEKRWNSVRVHRATQPARVDVVCLKYNPTYGPVDQSTDNYGVAASAVAQTPTS